MPLPPPLRLKRGKQQIFLLSLSRQFPIRKVNAATLISSLKLTFGYEHLPSLSIYLAWWKWDMNYN